MFVFTGLSPVRKNMCTTTTSEHSNQMLTMNVQTQAKQVDKSTRLTEEKEELAVAQISLAGVRICEQGIIQKSVLQAGRSVSVL